MTEDMVLLRTTTVSLWLAYRKRMGELSEKVRGRKADAGCEGFRNHMKTFRLSI